MIKSIFFRALTLLGLTFVLIGCGAAEPADAGGTGTPGAAGVSMEDVTKEVEKLIRDSKGKLDTTDGQAVATKIVSIMKASQPIGSCSLFSPTIFSDITTVAANAAVPPYIAKGSAYDGGAGTLTVIAAGPAGKVIAALGAIDNDGFITYTYDKYSIDGQYQLDGVLKFKVGAATVVTTPGVSKLTIEASPNDELTLSVVGDAAKKIATLKITAATVIEYKASAGDECGPGNYKTLATTVGATVAKAAGGAATFADFTMSVKTANTSAHAGAQVGTNLTLLNALIGPRYS